MTMFDPSEGGLRHTLDSPSEGWYALRQRAAHALSYFTPFRFADLDASLQHLMAGVARWAVLPAEVREETDRIVVKLEVAGMREEDFDIEVVEDTLVIRGHKHVETPPPGARFFVLERAYGSFERLIHFPSPVDQSQARADYRRRGVDRDPAARGFAEETADQCQRRLRILYPVINS